MFCKLLVPTRNTYRKSKAFSTKSDKSNYHTFTVNIPKLSSFKNLFGNTFFAGNEDDLSKLNTLTKKYNITDEMLREHKLSGSWYPYHHTHTENIIRYIKLDQRITPGTIILCDDDDKVHILRWK